MYSLTFLKNNLFKNVLVLMTGTIVAQVIPIIIIPILTRIYSPQEFGHFALYAAVVSIFSVIATGRYELAIMLPETDNEAKILLQISIFISVFISTILFIVFFVFSKEIDLFFGSINIKDWLFFVPLATFFAGCSNALSYWINRQKRFKDIALTNINKNLSQGVAQITLGSFKIAGGLIYGQLLGMFCSVLFLLFRSNSYKKIIKKTSLKKVHVELKKYRRFPYYDAVGALCNVGAAQMPIFVLAKYYSVAVTGAFNLTLRMLSVPTSLISSSVSKVLFQKIVEINNNNPHNLKVFILKAFVILFIIIFPVIPLIWYFGESLFSFILGEEWRVAGKYASYLVFAVAMKFCVSPLSSVMALNHNIKKGVAWQFLYLFTLSVTLLCCYNLKTEQFILVFTVHEVILYFIYLIIIVKSTSTSNLRAE